MRNANLLLLRRAITFGVHECLQSIAPAGAILELEHHGKELFTPASKELGH